VKKWTSIDPGCTGWAWWEGLYLVGCGVEENADAVGIRGDLVIEKPQIYRASKSKADPNDLITLAIQVGQYVERARRAGMAVKLVTPAEWKGQVAKEIIVPRILGALNEGERALATRASLDIAKGKVHNMIEAIGIGLHACGRMGRGGV
jgi:hypothetical protein